MTTPVISIVIATRERPQKLARLLRVIQQQELREFECIVVDDASSAATIAQYDELWRALDDPRFSLHLRPQSGGPAQGRNTGIALARGSFIAFCDDDDYWTRSDHLQVAARVLTANGGDFFFANMQTSTEQGVDNPNWYATLMQSCGPATVAGEADVHRLGRPALAEFLRHRIFHANTLVLSRALLSSIGGYWEKISFAEDHDLSFRLADAAQRVFFRSTVTADLDVSHHPSIARTYSEKERVLFGLLAIVHAESVIKDAGLRRTARGNRAWRLLELAEMRSADGQLAPATDFVWQSLLLRPSKRAAMMGLQLLKSRLLRSGAHLDSSS